MNAMTQPVMTLEAFLARENEQPEKHEFHRGEVFAMAGARQVHGCVVGNLMRHFGNRLAGSGCRAFSDGMKIQIADETILYPGLFVTCDKADLGTELVLRAPTLIIEVLSPSIQACDRSAEFAIYRGLASLQEYILVDPDTRRVEGFRRGSDGLWVLHDMSEGPALEAASVGVTVRLADVFDGIDPPPG